MTRDMRELRERAEAKLQELDLEQPFGLENLCLRLAARRGRPIHLRAVALPTRPTGAWLATYRADYVFYERDTSAFHQEHIILHELGHVLADHRAVEVDVVDISRLLTHLDSTLVGQVLTRTGFSTADEQEAEVFASTVQLRARALPRSPTAAAQEVAEVLLRLESAMGDAE